MPITSLSPPRPITDYLGVEVQSPFVRSLLTPSADPSDFVTPVGTVAAKAGSKAFPSLQRLFKGYDGVQRRIDSATGQMMKKGLDPFKMHTPGTFSRAGVPAPEGWTVQPNKLTRMYQQRDAIGDMIQETGEHWVRQGLAGASPEAADAVIRRLRLNERGPLAHQGFWSTLQDIEKGSSSKLVEDVAVDLAVKRDSWAVDSVSDIPASAWQEAETSVKSAIQSLLGKTPKSLLGR